MKEILYHMAVCFGSARTISVWENISVCQEVEKYFSTTKYILVDTAFSPGNHCIISNKCVSGTKLPEDKEQFDNAYTLLV